MSIHTVQLTFSATKMRSHLDNQRCCEKKITAGRNEEATDFCQHGLIRRLKVIGTEKLTMKMKNHIHNLLGLSDLEPRNCTFY